MDDFKIDSETANLIVQTYQKINTLKGLLDNEPYPQIKEFIESGTELGEMMNNAIKEITPDGFETKLSTISLRLKNLLSYSDNIQNNQENKKIIELFNQLMADISLLQSKINAEK